MDRRQPGNGPSNLVHSVKNFYAVSGTRAVVCSSGMFAFNQTFARHRPKNGAAKIIAKATAIATCIYGLLFL
jgi:hypothetical protein